MNTNKSQKPYLNYSKELKELKNTITRGKQEISQQIAKNKKEINNDITIAKETISSTAMSATENINNTADIAKEIIIKNKESLLEKIVNPEAIIALVALIVSIISLMASCSGQQLSKKNAPLIITYKEKPKEIDDNNMIKLSFNKEQGEISRVYKVEFSDEKICYTQVTDYSTSDKSFVVTIPIMESDEFENDFYTDYFSAQATTSFALALLDYNNNLYIYYVVVRPAPKQTKEMKIERTLNRGNTPIANTVATVDNSKSWKSKIALVDCSFPNDISIKKSVLAQLNDENDSNSSFTYNEENGYFQSSFLMFSKNQELKSSQGEEASVHTKLVITHINYNLEKDLKLIRSIPDDFIINSATQDVRITG